MVVSAPDQCVKGNCGMRWMLPVLVLREEDANLLAWNERLSELFPLRRREERLRVLLCGDLQQRHLEGPRCGCPLVCRLDDDVLATLNQRRGQRLHCVFEI
jgi:hypothetical protein